MILPVEVDLDVMTENAYFFIDDETNCGFLIDPGAQADLLLKIINERGWTIEKILLTHGHFDHIGAVNEIQRALKIPVCMSKGGEYYAKNSGINCSAFCCDDSIVLIPAPGHTSDGAIYYSEKNSVAFVGDTIFAGSYGRTDLPGGSEVELIKTLREKVFALPDETLLLCGHGPATTVAAEKSHWWY